MPANDRDNSIFIRESRSVRNKRIALIIIIDLMIVAIYGVCLYAMLLNQSIIRKIIGVVFSAAVDIAAVRAMIKHEEKIFRSFADAVQSEDEAVFTDMERQAGTIQAAKLRKTKRTKYVSKIKREADSYGI